MSKTVYQTDCLPCARYAIYGDPPICSSCNQPTAKVPLPPMGPAAKKILRILNLKLGCPEISWIRIERTYAGHHQKSEGWATWVAYDMRNFIVCGSQWPVRALTMKNTVQFDPCWGDNAMLIGPK